MKSLLAFTLLASLQTQAALICNDQNSHSVFELSMNQDQSKVKLTTLLGDSSVLAAGTKELRKVEGESNETESLFGGKTNHGHDVALFLNTDRALSLKKGEILEIDVRFEEDNSGVLSGETLLLCSEN